MKHWLCTVPLRLLPGLFVILVLSGCNQPVTPAGEAATGSVWAPSFTPQVETTPAPQRVSSQTTPHDSPLPTQAHDQRLATGEPLPEQSWRLSRGCAGQQIALPYRSSDGSMGLAITEPSENPGAVYWDWQNEPLAAQYSWLDIRPLQRSTVTQNALLFLGLDNSSQWWIGVVSNLCATPQLIGLLPTADPASAFLAILWLANDEPEYWVVEKDELRVYGWDSGTASLRWSLADVPHDAVSPRRFIDITGDGEKEVFLRWYRWYEGVEWSGTVELYQFLQVDEDGYHLIGEIEPGFQVLDLDSSSVIEVLVPQPAETPQFWRVYGWNGKQFVWSDPLIRPSAPISQVPPLTDLPPLPTDLYFKRAGSDWIWPREGGALQQQLRPDLPAVSTQCPTVAQAGAVVSWSPNCRFALVNIPGVTEGNRYGVKDTTSGEVMEIPATFTYTQGHSSFAWDPDSNFLIHARADGAPGLYLIDLSTGAMETLLSLSSDMEFGFSSYGAVDPTVLADGSVAFTIQGAQAYLYPPVGVYRLEPGGELQMLAEIAEATRLDDDAEQIAYGRLTWSPEQTMFLYQSPLSGSEAPPYATLILGMADGTALWDLAPILGDAREVSW